MAINGGKVVVGGLAAGVVMNVIDFASNMLMKDRFTAEMNALNPTLAANAMSTQSMVAFIVCDFIFGLLLIWTYAAIRPRFGPGSGTAVKAGLLFWLFGGTLWASLCAMGMFSWGFFAISGCVYLVNLLVSANVGAMLYKEE